MLETIVFDFGGVLFTFDRIRFIAELARYSSLSTTALFHSVYGTSSVFQQYEMGKLSTVDFFAHIVKVGKVEGITLQTFEDLYTRSVPIVPALLLVPQLATKFTLAILSNTSELHFEHILHRHPVAACFTHFFLSYEQGVMKPDPRIYEQAIHSLGGAAETMLFVDDVPENLAPAKLLGMQTHLFQLPGSAAYLKNLL